MFDITNFLKNGFFDLINLSTGEINEELFQHANYSRKKGPGTLENFALIFLHADSFI